MKIYIDYDEWFPVYYLVDDSPAVFEVTEEQAERWKRILREFKEMQDELESLHGKWMSRKEKA